LLQKLFFGTAVLLALAACSGGASTPQKTVPPSGPTPIPTTSEQPTQDHSAGASVNPVTHDQLIAVLSRFVDGEDVDGRPFLFPQIRFAEYATAGEFLPENIINTENTRIDLTAPAVAARFQGVVLGEEEVLSSKTNVKSLVVYVGFESKSNDPRAKNFYIPFNLGRIGIDSDEWDTTSGYIWNSPIHQAEILPVLQVEQRLRIMNGKNIIAGFAIYNGDMLNTLRLAPSSAGRSGAEYLAQIDISKALVLWMEKTMTNPYRTVPLDRLIRNIVNYPVTDLASVIPSSGNVNPYPD
jgi:hypothetical protein